jgi:hypothetical protein
MGENSGGLVVGKVRVINVAITGRGIDQLFLEHGIPGFLGAKHP